MYLQIYACVLFFVYYKLSVSFLLISGQPLNKDLYYDDEDEWYKNFFPNSTCYFNKSDEQDALSSVSETEFSDNSIFFIETSCKTGLDSRQACAVESAARAHPHRKIIVLFLAPIRKEQLSKAPLETLSQFSNVFFFRIHLNEYTKGTAIEKLVASNAFKKSKYYIHQTSDILRFLTLNKYGGIYLDLDVIILRSLDNLPQSKNWAGSESPGEVGTALLGLSKDGIGKTLSSLSLSYVNKFYDPNEWIKGRVDIFSSVLEKFCNKSRTDCENFRRYTARKFYPVPEVDYKRFLKPTHKKINITGIYAFHFWNYLTGDEDVKTDSLLSRLASKFCPKVYNEGLFGFKTLYLPL